MQVLLQFLTGHLTLAEICRTFRDDVVGEITGLIKFLVRNGFVTHILDDARDEVHPTLERQFETQMKLLGHCSDRPWTAFRDFRSTRLLLAGYGLSFRTCATVLLRSGIERISLLPVPTSQAENDLQEVNDVANSIMAQGVSAHVSIVEPEHQESLEEYDLVACCMDLPYLRDLVAIERRSTLLGRPFYPAIIVGNQGFMGPMIRPDSHNCLVCCVLRLAYDFIDENLSNSFRKNYVQLNLPFGPEFTPSNQVTKMIGAEVAFELFKALAGDIRPELRSCLQVYTVDNQGAIRVDLVPHPPDSCLGFCSTLGERQIEYNMSINVGEWLRAHTIHNT